MPMLPILLVPQLSGPGYFPNALSQPHKRVAKLFDRIHLENQFPHARILNLDLDLNTGASTGEREKLSFKMEIVTLVKPNPS